MPEVQKPVLIIGPCVIESPEILDEIADSLLEQLHGIEVEFYFKASFDKANRTSIDGFRGPGLKAGLKMLAQVKERLNCRICTDVHLPDQAEPVAEVADMIQVPAFLCRQTDLLMSVAEAALRTGKKVNVKKGQFLSPQEMVHAVTKLRAVEKKLGLRPDQKGQWIHLTERGSSFGYQNLMVDMGSFDAMSAWAGVRTIYDATHSVQTPGGGADGKSTGGRRERIEPLVRAAMAAGAQGLFMEVHPRPELALSDGPNAWPLEHAGTLVRQALMIQEFSQRLPRILRKGENKK